MYTYCNVVYHGLVGVALYQASREKGGAAYEAVACRNSCK